MVDMKQYSLPVHRSLLQRELLGGVPQIGMLLIFIFGVVFIYGLRLWFTIVPIILAYFIMRHLTKKDPWLIDIVLENISQKDVLLP